MPLLFWKIMEPTLVQLQLYGHLPLILKTITKTKIGRVPLVE